MLEKHLGEQTCSVIDSATIGELRKLGRSEWTHSKTLNRGEAFTISLSADNALQRPHCEPRKRGNRVIFI